MFTGLDPLFLGQSLSQRSPEELSVAPKASLAAPVLAFQYINGALRWDFGNVRHTQELAEQSCFLEDFTSYHLGWKLAAGLRPKPTCCIGLVLFTFMGMGLIPSWGPHECTCMVQSCLCHWAFTRGAVYQLFSATTQARQALEASWYPAAHTTTSGSSVLPYHRSVAYQPTPHCRYPMRSSKPQAMSRLDSNIRDAVTGLLTSKPWLPFFPHLFFM